jgi:hypothetical protein
MNHEEAQPKRIGRIRRGWLATKGSWTVLKMDKRLMLFSLAGYLISWDSGRFHGDGRPLL